MDNEQKRNFLNTFYRLYLKRTGIKPKEYVQMMHNGLNKDPMKAELKAIHKIQREILRSKGFIK